VRHHDADDVAPPQYTSTSTVACSTDFTTSSNLRSFVWAYFSFAALHPNGVPEYSPGLAQRSGAFW
jgi:hypothetical protein